MHWPLDKRDNSMKCPTVIAHMRSAFQQYRIDQPDSYTFAIYGPDDFCELHDSFSAAFERREELGLLAALRATNVPVKAMIDAGEIALEDGHAGHVWQALVSAIADEYEASRKCEADALVD